MAGIARRPRGGRRHPARPRSGVGDSFQRVDLCSGHRLACARPLEAQGDGGGSQGARAGRRSGHLARGRRQPRHYLDGRAGGRGVADRRQRLSGADARVRGSPRSCRWRHYLQRAAGRRCRGRASGRPDPRGPRAAAAQPAHRLCARHAVVRGRRRLRPCHLLSVGVAAPVRRRLPRARLLRHGADPGADQRAGPGAGPRHRPVRDVGAGPARLQRRDRRARRQPDRHPPLARAQRRPAARADHAISIHVQTRLGPDMKKHFSMIRGFHLADFFTLANAACGVGAVFLTMRYLQSGAAAHFYAAAAMAPLAFFFDWLDGNVARWRHQRSTLGRELDSLADVISFGVAPAALAYAAGLDGGWDAVALIYFVCCGVSRLARFNVTAETLSAGSDSGKVAYFEGTPIPTSVVLTAVLAFAGWQGRIGDQLYAGTWQLGPWEFHPLSLLFIASGSMMISKTLRIPKP